MVLLGRSAELLSGHEARAWFGEGLELAGVGDRVSERPGEGSYPDRLLEIAARGGGIRPLLRDVLSHLVEMMAAQTGAVLLWREETPPIEIVGITRNASPLVSALLGLSSDQAAQLRRVIEAADVPVMLGPGVPPVEVAAEILQAAGAGPDRFVLLPVGSDAAALGLLVFGSNNDSWPDLRRVRDTRDDLVLIANLAGLQRRLEQHAAGLAAAGEDRQALLDLWAAEDPWALMRRLAETSARIARAHTAAAGLVLGQTLLYRDAVVEGKHEKVTIRHRSGGHPQGRVLESGEAHAQPDDGRPRLCVVPVRGPSGEVLAVFEVHARPGHVFGAAVPDRLSTLARAAGLVLQQLQRVESAQGRSAVWPQLLPAVRALARARSGDEIYAVLENLAREHFEAASAWLILPPVGEGDWSAWTAQPHLRQLAAGEIPLCTIPQPVMQEIADLEQTEFPIEDTARASLPIAEIVSQHGLASLLGLKLTQDGRTLGVVCFGWPEPAAFTPEHRDRLRLLTDDLRAALQRLGEPPAPAGPIAPVSRLQMLGTIASGVAHGLNNAIGGILGHAELASTRETIEEIRDDLTWVRTAAQQAAETLRRIQIATGVSTASEMHPLDANVLAVSGIALAQRTWQQRAEDIAGVVIETELRARLPIHGNAEQLEEVLVNLLTNGVEAMEGSGTLTVATWTAEEHTYFQIRDTGSGVHPEVRETLFDPFVSTQHGAGRGLGLAIAAGIVAAHQGEISIESEPARGTRVTIKLPVSQESADEVPSGGPLEPGVDLRILLVEDEASVRTAASEMLVRDGHDVVAVADAAAALEAFAVENFDLVITDLGLPRMSGWDLIEELRQRDPQVPSMVMTGYGEKPDAVRQSQLGVRVVLPKPFMSAELRSAVERALRGHGSSNGA